MSESFKISEDVLWAPAGLSLADCDDAFGCLLARQVDYAECFFQHTAYESWSLEGGIVKEGMFNIDHGLGVRAVSAEKTGFAYADAINRDALLQSARAARSITKQAGNQQVQAYQRVAHRPYYAGLNPMQGHNEQEKVDLLKRIDAMARDMDPRIIEVMASLAASYEVMSVVGSDGTYATDVRPLIRLSVSVVAESGGRREQGTSGGGGRRDYTYIFDSAFYENIVSEAVRVAVTNLEAIDMPAGTMDIVLGAGWPGVLLHEAVGHGLEGDFNRRGTSSFANLMGEQVASPMCTVVDNGTIEHARGSLNVDDEGTPTQETVLIEKGRLVGYMQDRLNAGLMGVKRTGNGRRESYAHLPMPRMTNTYMYPGEYTQEEIIASVDRGLYAVNFSGGQVDITSGKFVFVASEAYLIENGKLTSPVKGASLVGDGPSAMKEITMVGDDLALDLGIGVCGKDGQSVPVGVGQPTIRINHMTVGGTA